MHRIGGFEQRGQTLTSIVCCNLQRRRRRETRKQLRGSCWCRTARGRCCQSARQLTDHVSFTVLDSMRLHVKSGCRAGTESGALCALQCQRMQPAKECNLQTPIGKNVPPGNVLTAIRFAGLADKCLLHDTLHQHKDDSPRPVAPCCRNQSCIHIAAADSPTAWVSIRASCRSVSRQIKPHVASICRRCNNGDSRRLTAWSGSASLRPGHQLTQKQLLPVSRFCVQETPSVQLHFRFVDLQLDHALPACWWRRWPCAL